MEEKKMLYEKRKAYAIDVKENFKPRAYYQMPHHNMYVIDPTS